MKKIDPWFSVSFVELAPEDAKKLLDASPGNVRPINAANVALLARTMRSGQWFHGHQLSLNPDGKLINGHHTCYAVIEYGEAVPVAIIRYNAGQWDPNTLVAIDSIQARRPHQRLNACERATGGSREWSTKHLTFARAFELVANGCRFNESAGQGGQFRLDAVLTRKLRDRFPAAFEWATDITRNGRRGLSARIIGCAAATWIVEREASEEFAEGYATQEGLKKGMPAYAMLRWEDRNDKKDHGGGNYAPYLAALFCLKAQLEKRSVDRAVCSTEAAAYWQKRLAAKKILG